MPMMARTELGPKSKPGTRTSIQISHRAAETQLFKPSPLLPRVHTSRKLESGARSRHETQAVQYGQIPTPQGHVLHHHILLSIYYLSLSIYYCIRLSSEWKKWVHKWTDKYINITVQQSLSPCLEKRTKANPSWLCCSRLQPRWHLSLVVSQWVQSSGRAEPHCKVKEEVLSCCFVHVWFPPCCSSSPTLPP